VSDSIGAHAEGSKRRYRPALSSDSPCYCLIEHDSGEKEKGVRKKLENGRRGKRQMVSVLDLLQHVLRQV
jgi:hypothetical protein